MCTTDAGLSIMCNVIAKSYIKNFNSVQWYEIVQTNSMYEAAWYYGFCTRMVLLKLL